MELDGALFFYLVVFLIGYFIIKAWTSDDDEE